MPKPSSDNPVTLSAAKLILAEEDIAATLMRSIRCFKRNKHQEDVVQMLVSIHGEGKRLMGCALSPDRTTFGESGAFDGTEDALVAAYFSELLKLDTVVAAALQDYLVIGGGDEDRVRISFQIIAPDTACTGSANSEPVELGGYDLYARS